MKAEAAATVTAGAMRLSLRAMTQVASMALLITAVKRGPGVVVRGTPAQGMQIVRDLQTRGISITEQEALAMASEACIANPVHRQKLEEMVKGSESASPMLEQLARNLKEIGL